MRIDNNFIAELGLGDLPEPAKKSLLASTIEELETRVGTRIAAGLTEIQLQEFEDLMEVNDEARATAWLSSNCPEAESIVGEEVDTIKHELRSRADYLLESVRESAVAG